MITQDMDVVEAYIQILRFPVDYPDVVPSLIPLFLGLVVLELYFGRYREEHLGWNSAVSNATMLLATGLTLVYELHLSNMLHGPRAIVAAGILMAGFVILVLNFSHRWPAQVAFNVSSAFLTYTVTYLTIAVVYAQLPVTLDTLLAASGVLLTLFLVLTGIKTVEHRLGQGRQGSPTP